MLKSLTRLFSGSPKDDAGDDSGNKRKDDYIIVVCQRNDIKKLQIESVDPELAAKLGYSEEELKKKVLGEILPPHTNELLNDYLEYGGEGNDLLAVLSKVRDFSLVTKGNKNIALSLRILPTTALDTNPRFCLIFRQASLQKILDAGRDEIYRALRKNMLIQDTGVLPQRETLIKDIEVVISYIKKGGNTASIALVALRNLSDLEVKHGAEIAEKALQEIVFICKSNFREDDIIAKSGSNKVAIVLLEATVENSMTPLNRLRWKINAHEVEAGEQKSKVSAAIVCTPITGDDTAESVLSACERAVIGDEVPGVTIIG